MPALDINWDAIEREFRAGQMSNREIARVHQITEGAIRKKAKALGWEKDLSALVEQHADAKLVRREAELVLGAEVLKQSTDKQVVEAAAERRADLIEGHRRDAHAARTLVRSLLGELASLTGTAQKERVAAEKAKAEAKAQADAAAVAEITEKQKAAALKSLGDRATIAQKLSASIATLVSVERESLLGKRPEEDSDESRAPFRMFFGGQKQKDRTDAGKPVAPTEAARTTH